MARIKIPTSFFSFLTIKLLSRAWINYCIALILPRKKKKKSDIASFRRFDHHKACISPICQCKYLVLNCFWIYIYRLINRCGEVCDLCHVPSKKSRNHSSPVKHITLYYVNSNVLDEIRVARFVCPCYFLILHFYWIFTVCSSSSNC